MTQLSFDLDFRTAYGRDNYFVGPSNQTAIDFIDKWPDWGRVPFLIVYGDEGSGKKHLASVWQDKSNAGIFDAKRFRQTPLEEIISKPCDLIIHQLHLLIGDEESEEKLFHIYNHFFNSTPGRYVLLTSRFAPSELDIDLADLASRLRGATSFRIKSPDDEILLQVLGKQLNDKGFQVTEELLKYALLRMDRSWAMPRRLAETVSRMSLETKKGLSRKLIQEALINIEQGPENQPYGKVIPPAAGKLNHS